MPQINIDEDKLEKSLKTIRERMTFLEADLLEVKCWKHPESLEGKLEALFQQVDTLTKGVVLLAGKFESYMNEKPVPEYTNDEIKDAWIKSGVSQKEVQEHMHIAQQTASQYCRGEISDVITRHKLVMFFKKRLNEKKAEI